MQMTYYHDLNFLFVLAHQLRFGENSMFVVVENENPALTECMVFMVACLM